MAGSADSHRAAKIVVVSCAVAPRARMPWEPSGDWPLLEEDGTAAVHMHNIGPDYERKRRRAIATKAEQAHADDIAAGKGWTYGLRVQRAVAAQREEREFYRVVFLSDQDRGLVFYLGLPPHPAGFREIAHRLRGDMARRQVRRALRSLVSRGVVRSEQRRLPNGKLARLYSPDREAIRRLTDHDC